MTLKLRDKAPRFALPADDGGVATLAACAGRPVVVYFYPKDDTTGCTREAKDFSALAADFAAAGTEIIGISHEALASKQKFKKKHDLAVRLAADPQHHAIAAYGVWVEKSMYGRKYMGVERATFLVDGKGRLARIWRNVKVPGHADEVLAAVRELTARD